MMVAVHKRLRLPREPLQKALRPYFYVVRMPVSGRTLFVLEGLRHLGSDVLDQTPSPENVPDLHPETDGQERQALRLNLLQDEQVRLVLERMHRAESQVRLAPVAQRVHVRGAPWQKHAVQSPDESLNQLR